MNESERAQAIAFTLYSQDLEIIDGADTNNAGRSGTLRRIIREWAAAQAEPARVLVDGPGVEYQVEGGK